MAVDTRCGEGPVVDEAGVLRFVEVMVGRAIRARDEGSPFGFDTGRAVAYTQAVAEVLGVHYGDVDLDAIAARVHA